MVADCSSSGLIMQSLEIAGIDTLSPKAFNAHMLKTHTLKVSLSYVIGATLMPIRNK